MGLWDRTAVAIGVVHLHPLPGAPSAQRDFDAVLEAAMSDAQAYKDAGFDAVLVENHGDAPFRKERCEPHVAASLALCARQIRDAYGLPVGINCLRNDAHSALGAAAVSGAAMIRVNVLVGAVATDQGLIEGCADSLLRYRQRLGAEVDVLADVNVKFGTPLYDAPAPALAVTTIERGGARGVIVTGSQTGSPPDVEQVAAIKDAVGTRGPVLVGSGADPANVAAFAAHCDGFIVGSSCKRNGDPHQAVDVDRARAFMSAVSDVRTTSSTRDADA
ncbi:MAG: phosphorybosylanthranilate isomerase [Planctomycetes bacterium]|nr:phosphorybosylanthranilate isomerase [Planctomycetota bacterium]